MFSNNTFFPTCYLDEHKHIFSKIMQVFQTKQGGVIFRYNYGETGKILWGTSFLLQFIQKEKLF